MTKRDAESALAIARINLAYAVERNHEGNIKYWTARVSQQLRDVEGAK